MLGRYYLKNFVQIVYTAMVCQYCFISHKYYIVLTDDNLLHEYVKYSLRSFDKKAHVENCQLIFNGNLLIGSCMLSVFAEGIPQ